jgi:hypothetical protein
VSARRGGRRAFLLATVASAALLLSGCVGLPTGGGVSTEEIDTGVENPSQLVLPESPQSGASPEEILQGFIRAGRGPQDGYRVAREFLTDDFRSEWKPNAGVIISNSVIAPAQVDADTFEVTLTVLATVNASGNYTELVPPETTEPPLTYTVEQNADGEWRIASAPDGTVLSETRFNNTFNPYELSFFDASGDYLVPDLRWFPDTSSTKDRIVTELLNGQSPWLSSGVLVTAFPTGTKLGDPVEIEAGQATVDLSAEVRSLSGPARQRMLQQLTASLRELADVRSVRITVGGLPLPIPEGGPQAKRVPTVGTNPLVLLDGSFGFLNGTSVTEVPDISAKVEALSPFAVTLGPTREVAAVLSATGAAFALASQADPIPLDPRQGLVAPGLDVEGYLWSITADGSGGLLAFNADNDVRQIPVSIPSGARVVSIDISRDGARLVLGLQTPEGPRLEAWGIVRDSSLAPVRLGDEPLVVAIDDAPILDTAWVDGVTVAVLSSAGAIAAVDLYQLGGKAASRGSLTGGVVIAGGNGVEGIRILDSSGVLYRPSGSRGWQSSGTGVSLLGTQQ